MPLVSNSRSRHSDTNPLYDRAQLHNYDTKVRKLLGNQENYCTFVVHKWKTGNGQDYVQTRNKRLYSLKGQLVITY